MKFGLHSVNLHTCALSRCRRADRPRRRGRRLRIALGGRPRRAARPAGARAADAAGSAPARPDRRADVPGRAHHAHPARHRRHHPAAAPGAGAGQAARLARRALERPAHLRARRGLVRAGDALGRRAVRRARPRRRRLPGGDARGVDAAQAVVQGPVRVVRRACRRCRARCRRRRRPSSWAAGRAPAYRRAVTQGHGWYGFGLDVDETQKIVAALARGRQEALAARPSSAGSRSASRRPATTCRTRRRVDAYAAAGVDRLILRPRPGDGRGGARALRRRDRPRARPAGGVRRP